MFIVNTDRIVEWPVEVAEIPGVCMAGKFSGHFRLLSQGEIDAVYGDGGNDRDLLGRVLTEVSGLEINGATPTLAEVVDVPFLRTALVRAYIETMSGARRKNSAMPRATGRAADAPNGTAPDRSPGQAPSRKH